MNILIAEDDGPSRRALRGVLLAWGYQVIDVASGDDAWAVLSRPDGPRFAILDRNMPGLDGVEVCRRVRAADDPSEPAYVLLLTAMSAPDAVVEGFEAGANDYLTKPFNPAELAARLRVGRRVVELQHSLAQRVRELEAALGRVKRLEGLIPICAWCKKIRADRNYWQQVEVYLGDHTDARFSHSICPECLDRERDGMG